MIHAIAQSKMLSHFNRPTPLLAYMDWLWKFHIHFHNTSPHKLQYLSKYLRSTSAISDDMVVLMRENNNNHHLQQHSYSLFREGCMAWIGKCVCVIGLFFERLALHFSFRRVCQNPILYTTTIL